LKLIGLVLDNPFDISNQFSQEQLETLKSHMQTAISEAQTAKSLGSVCFTIVLSLDLSIRN
jgi:hypothetical protein